MYQFNLQIALDLGILQEAILYTPIKPAFVSDSNLLCDTRLVTNPGFTSFGDNRTLENCIDD